VAGRLRIAAAAVAVLGVVAGVWGGVRLVAGPSCSGQLGLSVTAAPEIAPAVRAAAAQWAADKPSVNGRCVSVRVVAGESADVAAAVAVEHQSTLNWVGGAAGRTTVPDVWIADSSTWLQRLRSQDARWVPGDAPSIARSPVVLAVPEPTATALGWPDRKLTWADLPAKVATDARLRTGIVEPSRDASGLSALLALAAATGPGGTGQQANVGALRALATARSQLRADLLARFPRGPDDASLASGLSAAPLSEQAVIGYDAARPAVPLAAVYLDPAAAPLDFPFAILPGTTPDRQAAARAMLAALAGRAFRDRLAPLGLRAADGGAGTGFAAPRGAPTTLAAPAATAEPAAIDAVLATWSAVTSPGRLLAVIDASGSMAQPVSAAGGATREQVAVEVARRGLALFGDDWAVGMWMFAARVGGANAYRQLVPIGPLSLQRLDLLGHLSTIRPQAGGAGLYDTTLAAYKAAQADWDPTRVNSVVIMTAGRNDDTQGISLNQLADALRNTVDPARPVQVIAIGIGDDVPESALRAITDRTGGGTFVASDPATIGEVFLKAITLRTATRR
jgi:hypothetical protein